MNSIFREITPLSERDCFMIFSRVKDEFTFPIHIHAEYELNFIENGAGARRVVGDSIEDIDDLELTLVTRSNLEHGWLNHNCKSKEIKEITIQFHKDLLNEHLLEKNQFRSIKEMLEKGSRGITFPKDSILKIKKRLYSLAAEREGAHSVLKLFGILYDLSLSSLRVLSSQSFNASTQSYDSRRVDKAYHYMTENYNKPIHLSHVANLVGMTEVAFSRFLKKRTGCNFIDLMNDIRLGHASRMLIDTTHSISEICSDCGFNNLSNFNRLFKKKRGCTPRELREGYKETKYFL